MLWRTRSRLKCGSPAILNRQPLTVVRHLLALGGTMDVCILFGAAIAGVVSLAKRVGFIRNNPKIVAALLSAAAVAWQHLHGGTGSVDVAALVGCFAAQFSTSVATYEVAIQPVRKAAERALLS